jgi:hypothetical protein
VEKNFPSFRPGSETSPSPSLRVENLLNPSQDHVDYSEIELKDSRWGFTKLGDDTIKALRYCLSFLKYGIDTMNHQLSILGKSLGSGLSGVL